MTAVGVIGAGQLARMLAVAGIPLGLRFVFLDPARDASAASLGTHLCAEYDDPVAQARLARLVDVATYEFENVSHAAVEDLAVRVPVLPSSAALSVARDRLREKALFQLLGIPTPWFAAVDSWIGLKRAVADIGLPAVLKTRTLGYDGKGQAVLHRPTDLAAAWARLGGVPLLLESLVEFQREVSVLAVRGRGGETAFYPISENTHRDGVLWLARSRPGDAVAAQAQQYANRLVEHLGYVGVLALELFQVGDALVANEIAPRVHNSGHWTIEGAVTSQFENHLRAILGVPLGSTEATGAVAMVNFVGEIPASHDVLSVPNAHLHLYDKPPRPGRKLGHVTVLADSERELGASLDRLLQLAGSGGAPSGGLPTPGAAEVRVA